MGVAARQSIITTALNYVGVAIGAFNTLWLLPKAMTTGEIGLYRVIISMAVLCVPFAQMGIIQSSLKYFPGYQTKTDRNRLFSALILLVLAGFILFLIISWLLKTPISTFFEARSPDVKNYYDLVISLVFLMIIFGLLESFSRNYLQIVVPNLIKELFLRALASILILLYLLNFLSFNEMLYGLIINYSLSILVLAIFLNSKYGLFPTATIRGVRIKELINYALFAVLGTGGAVIVMQIDSILVTGLLGLDMNGVYTTAFFIAVVVEIPRRGISQVSTTLISSAFHAGDLKSVEKIYRKTSINLMLIAMLIYMLIILNLDQLFYFIPDWQRFQAGKIVVVLVGLGKLIDLTFGVNTEVIIMSKHFKFNIIAIATLSILTILTNLWLIPPYGLMGAALATFISLTVFNIIKYIFILVKIGIQPFHGKSILALLIGVLSFGIVYFIPDTGLHFIVNILIRSFLLTLIFVFLNIFFRTSEDIPAILRSIRESLIRR
jgi:O-antigen/teichoic acid export membrane protein